MLSLQPVLVHFFVDIDNITLLQSQLPAGKSGVGVLLPEPFFFRPCLAPTHPSSLLPTKALPFPSPTVQTAQAGRGRAEKATYLGF